MPEAVIVPVVRLLMVVIVFSVRMLMAMPPGSCAEAIVPAFWIREMAPVAVGSVAIVG